MLGHGCAQKAALCSPAQWIHPLSLHPAEGGWELAFPSWSSASRTKEQWYVCIGSQGIAVAEAGTLNFL